jgi:hypothetical protein
MITKRPQRLRGAEAKKAREKARFSVVLSELRMKFFSLRL